MNTYERSITNVTDIINDVDECDVVIDENLLNKLRYCAEVAYLLLDKVMEPHDDYVLELTVTSCLLNLLYPHTKHSAFIRKAQHKLARSIEEYEVEFKLLSLLGDNDYTNMTNYVMETFFNLI